MADVRRSRNFRCPPAALSGLAALEGTETQGPLGLAATFRHRMAGPPMTGVPRSLTSQGGRRVPWQWQMWAQQAQNSLTSLFPGLASRTPAVAENTGSGPIAGSSTHTPTPTPPFFSSLSHARQRPKTTIDRGEAHLSDLVQSRTQILRRYSPRIFRDLQVYSVRVKKRNEKMAVLPGPRIYDG